MRADPLSQGAQLRDSRVVTKNPASARYNGLKKPLRAGYVAMLRRFQVLITVIATVKSTSSL
jgi:hypothetical protein